MVGVPLGLIYTIEVAIPAQVTNVIHSTISRFVANCPPTSWEPPALIRLSYCWRLNLSGERNCHARYTRAFVVPNSDVGLCWFRMGLLLLFTFGRLTAGRPRGMPARWPRTCFHTHVNPEISISHIWCPGMLQKTM